MISDRFNLCKRSSVLNWCLWRRSSHIKKKRKSNFKIYLVINEYGMQVNFIITNGSFINCKEAFRLIKNIKAKLVLADRTHDTNEILSYLNQQNIRLAIHQNVIDLTSVITKILRF